MLDLVITARGTTPCDSLTEHLRDCADKLSRLDPHATRLEMEICIERNPRLKDRHARIHLTWTSPTGIRHATADAPHAHAALEKAATKLCRQLRDVSTRNTPVHGRLHTMASVRTLPLAVDEQLEADSHWLARAYFGKQPALTA